MSINAKNNHHTLNLKAVVQETGLKPDTLRAWERRYGLPQPRRTPGGHRLYSQQDIDLLRWLVARQAEGLSISRAVNLWHQVQQGVDTSLPVETTSTSKSIINQGEALISLRQAWIQACLSFDQQKVENTLTQAFALYPPETVCLEILRKGLAKIGEGWYKGENTVQQEHFASSLAMQRLEALIAAAPPPTRAKRLIVGCPPEETHVFAPLLITFLLRRQGWDVLYLGANVPSFYLATTVQETRTDLVIMAAQQLYTAANLLEMAIFLQREDIHLAYGGLIFLTLPELVDKITGYFLGPDIGRVTGQVEQLLQTPPSLKSIPPVAEIYTQAMHHYRTRQAHIETHTWNYISDKVISFTHLSRANLELSRNIIAALTLGDLSLLRFDLHWLAGLLNNHGLSSSQLDTYLSVYQEAVQTYLDPILGACILDWFAERQ